MVLYTVVGKDISSVICVGNELSWTETRAQGTPDDRVNGGDWLDQ